MKRPSNRVFVFVLVVMALLIGVAGTVAVTKPFQGEFSRACLIQLKGEINSVKSFFDGSEFKWIVNYKVNEVTYINDRPTYCVLPEIVADDLISFDTADSRFNLIVNSKPTDCYQDVGSPVKVCWYEVTIKNPPVILTEQIASSGLPEPKGSIR